MDQSLSSGRGYVSVLSCFPPSVGRDVAVAVVKPLRVGLGNPGTRSLLRTDRQVCVYVCVQVSVCVCVCVCPLVCVCVTSMET